MCAKPSCRFWGLHGQIRSAVFFMTQRDGSPRTKFWEAMMFKRIDHVEIVTDHSTEPCNSTPRCWDSR